MAVRITNQKMSNEFPVAKALSSLGAASGPEFDRAERIRDVKVRGDPQGRPPRAVLVASNGMAVDPEEVPEPSLPRRRRRAPESWEGDPQQRVARRRPIELDQPAHRGDGTGIPASIGAHRLPPAVRRDDVG